MDEIVSSKILYYCGNNIYTCIMANLPFNMTGVDFNEIKLAKTLIPDGYIQGGEFIYQIKDHLGNIHAEVDQKGVKYTTNYYPSGIQHDGHTLNADYAFGGKELQTSHGINLYDFEARYYDPIFGFTTMDPLCEKYYDVSPYSYCAGNPVNRIDPDGRDWYETVLSKTKEKQIVWTDYKSQDEMNENGVEGRSLGQVVAMFEGSRGEKLGEGDNLFGKGAILAKATVYGKKGENDIITYDAFTMSSDFSEYGAIADREYTVNYKDPGKGGVLSSNWALNNAGPVDCLDGVNPSMVNPYSPTQKTEFIYIDLIEMVGQVVKYQQGVY